MELRVTYDRSADAAYIYLTDVGPGEAARQVEAVPNHIIVDFDRDNRLLGIEILAARETLPRGFLRQAERIG